MSTYSVEIAGAPVRIEKGSLSIDKIIEERSTGRVSVVDQAGTADYVRGTPVEIFDAAAGSAFTGYVATSQSRRVAPTSAGLIHTIDLMDQHYLADKRLAVKSYLAQTCGAIVTDLWTDYLDAEGITVGKIDAGPTLDSAIFSYVKVSVCLDQLKELSGYIWYINQAKKLYFVDRSTYRAPWDMDSVTYRPIAGTVRRTSGNPLYRNRQYIRGGTGLTSEQTETFTGDGVTVAFTVGYPIAQEPTVTVAAAGQTIGIKGVSTGKQCYWNKGDSTITFTAAPGAVAVVVTYYGQYPLIAEAEDYGAQLARQAIEGGTGINEEIVTEAYHDTGTSMQASAKAKITDYCRDAVRFTYQTHHSGLEPGQMQAITYSPFGYTALDMLIESVRVSTYGQDIRYNVSAIIGPVLGSWTKFFTSLVTRQDATIKIGDSLLLVLLQQNESLSLAESTAQDEDDFSGEIVNRWIQEPPTTSAGHNVEHEKLNLAEAPTDSQAATEAYLWQ